MDVLSTQILGQDSLANLQAFGVAAYFKEQTAKMIQDPQHSHVIMLPEAASPLLVRTVAEKRAPVERGGLLQPRNGAESVPRSIKFK
jgi:hypothetical protein